MNPITNTEENIKVPAEEAVNFWLIPIRSLWLVMGFLF
jgi:hypothetical protein